jgi:hypothetical protein
MTTTIDYNQISIARFTIHYDYVYEPTSTKSMV